MVVKQGDTVKVNYIGTYEDGSVFDTSFENIAKENDLYVEARPYQPLEFKVGAGMMIKGFDEAVVNMDKGETKKITLSPEQAYGEISDEYITQVEMSVFKESGIEPKEGQSYQFQVGQGKVTKVENDKVTIDFNHPMAGKTLNFELTVEDIIEEGK